MRCLRSVPVLLTGVALTMLLTACQPARVLNTMVPSGSYQLTTDIAYGAHPRQQMDIYIPRQTPFKQQVVVFVYGGSWEGGSKQDFTFVAQAFARLGYVTVIPDYRLYPEVQFPSFIEDIAEAVAAVPEALNDQRLVNQCPSGHQFILAGHSAGAHTAALLAVDPQYLENAGVDISQIRAFIGLAGPYDLPLDHEQVKDKFTTVEGDEANPVALAHAKMPPALLIHGESDTIAVPDHSVEFKERLEALGVPATLRLYKRRRHVDLVASLASPLRFLSPAYKDIQAFLEEQDLAPCSSGHE